MTTAYVNGNFLPLETACVSVLDRGFLFADSVYEVIPVYAGHGFRLADHLQRLDNSLAGLRMHNPHDRTTWANLIAELIEYNGGGDLSVYVQVSRGAPARRDPRLPYDVSPTVVAFCQSRAAPDRTVMRQGIAAITHTDTRWRSAAIKSTSLLANILAADDARAAGAAEAILIRDGVVLEGTSSNVFAVLDNRLITPALRETILAGITRSVVLEIAADQDIDHAEVDTLTPAELRRASEIWITSSTREIFAVTRLDGEAVGGGLPGPLWTQMRAWLQAMAHE